MATQKEENIQRGIRNSLIIRASNRGYTVEEIADKMEIPENEVRRVIRAKVQKCHHIRKYKSEMAKV